MRKYLRDVKGKSLIWCINLVAGLAIFFFGYDQGMMGGVNTSPDYVRVMGLGYSTYEGPSEGWVATITEPTRQGGIVSIYYFGTLLGCLAAGIIGDKIGRIKTMWIGSVWVLVGASLQSSAQNIAWMLCARVINGIGTGFLNAVVPVWTAEVATHTSRGATIAMEFTLNIFGVVVAYWLEFGMGFVGDGNTEVRWRFPIAFQVLPLLVFMAVVPFMPESPRWLIKAGRNEEARHILYRLRWTEETDTTDTTTTTPSEKRGDVQVEKGDSGTATPTGAETDITQREKLSEMAQAEYDDIVGIVDLEKKHAGQNTYFSMFFGRHSGDLHIARRVQLNIWLQIVQEWAGIAAITVYAPLIFSSAGYSARKSEWLSGLNDITYCLSTLFAIYTIDRWGRRVGLWWGAVAQGICLLLAGAFGRLLKDHPEKAAEYGGAAAFFIFAYTAVFGATWLTIPWVYPTETFPLEVRAKGMAWGVVGWSIGNGWLTLMNPIMFSAIAENTLHIFAAVNFLSIPLVWAFYPETANRTLEEMDLLFASKSPFVWDMEKNFAKLKAENQGVSHMAHVGEHRRADEEMEVAGKV